MRCFLELILPWVMRQEWSYAPLTQEGISIRTLDIRCLISTCKIPAKYLQICSRTATYRQTAAVLHVSRAPPQLEVAEDRSQAPCAHACSPIAFCSEEELAFAYSLGI